MNKRKMRRVGGETKMVETAGREKGRRERCQEKGGVRSMADAKNGRR